MTDYRIRYGVVLAGGRASRMDFEDKSLLRLGNKPIIEWVIDAAQQQVEQLLLSVNHHAERYRYLNLQIVGDYTDAYSGPLVGIVSAMRLAKSETTNGSELLACFAADTPWFPDNLVAKLAEALMQSGSDAAIATSGDQQQPLFSVWSLSLLPLLETAVADGLFGPRLVLPRIKSVTVEFASKQNQFHNINSRQDLEQANRWLENSSTGEAGA